MDGDPLGSARRLVAPEGEVQAAVRSRAAKVTRPPWPEAGALLRWMALRLQARSVVEIGSAGGVSALWLLEGLGDRGLMTSIERDPQLHGMAAKAYEEAGCTHRVRSILGDAESVLPRLSDASYDLVLLQDDDANRYPALLRGAVRLLRDRGTLVARGVLRRGPGADALAQFLEELAEADGVVASILDIDDGLALAALV